MAAKSKIAKLDDQSILRIARGRVTESAAATFTELEIDTQLSIERGIIWMVEWVEFDFANLDALMEVAAGLSETIQVQLTKTTQTGIANRNDPDIIQFLAIRAARSAAIGTDAGPLWSVFESIKRFNFMTPFPVASQTIFMSILGSDASAVHTVSVRIGYTIKEVTDKFFFRVAQALVG